MFGFLTLLILIAKLQKPMIILLFIWWQNLTWNQGRPMTDFLLLSVRSHTCCCWRFRVFAIGGGLGHGPQLVGPTQLRSCCEGIFKMWLTSAAWPSAEETPPHHRGLYMALLRLSYKIPQTGQIKRQKSISHHSGGWKSKARFSTELISPESSFFSLSVTVLSLCVLMYLSLMSPFLWG